MTVAGFNLFHSPLVGRSTWRRVEQSLQRRGFATWRPQLSLEDLFSPDSVPWPDDPPPRSPWVVVVHSAAGFFAPMLAERAGMRRVLFVDALLPAPGESWLGSAPAALAAHITRLASDGVLPPWPTWFGASTMARLVPDEVVRAEFVAECRPIRLGMLTIPTPATPLVGRHAYLQLSEAYAEEAEQARNLGWRVHHEPLHHLAMLSDPDRIAALIGELAQDL